MAIDMPDIPTPQMPDSTMLKKIADFQVPSQAEFVEGLHGLEAVPAVALLVLGAISLVVGWKVFKLLVVANAAYLGGQAGAYLGNMIQHNGEGMWLFGMVAGGLLLAALAWPLMRYAVSVMGGLAGSFLGYGVWQTIADMTGRATFSQHAWAGALIGLITLGLLAFVIFKLVVMIFTAFEGAVLTVCGGVALLLKYEPIGASLRETLTENPLVLPMLVIIPAVIGFALQYNAAHKVTVRKQKALEGKTA